MTGTSVRSSKLLLLSCAVALLIFGRAHAQVPVTGYIVINPIDVCGSTGPTGATGCAPFNSANTSPSQATSTTPIGFVDSSTNINLTRAIWLQAGIDVTFLPIVEFDNAGYQSISDVTTTNNPLYSCLFWNLSTNGNTNVLKPPTGITCPTSLPPLKDPNCNTKHCSLPLASSKVNAVNMFFVNTINNNGLYGFGWLNNNGVAVGANVFSSSPRFDTMAHELGHNLSFDHTTFGAGWSFSTTTTGIACTTSSSTLSSPGGCNLMTNGTIRNVAASSGCTAASTMNNSLPTGGQLYNLDTGLYLSAPACSNTPPLNPISDFLIPSTQVIQAQKSGFINAQPNVNATAGGGDAAAAAISTSNGSSAPNCSFPQICVTNNNDPSCTSSSCYIASLILSTPEGYNFVGYQFQYVQGPKPKSTAVLKGNTGNGNQNCQKSLPIASNPTFQCLEIDFPVTVGPNGNYISNFGPQTTLVFNANIHNETTGQPATIAELGCSTAMPVGCLDLTEVLVNLFAPTAAFDQSGNASSQFPDPTVSPVIVDPANFPTLAKLSPPPTFTATPIIGVTAGCTPIDESGNCPTPVGGVGNDNGND